MMSKSPYPGRGPVVPDLVFERIIDHEDDAFGPRASLTANLDGGAGRHHKPEVKPDPVIGRPAMPDKVRAGPQHAQLGRPKRQPIGSAPGGEGGIHRGKRGGQHAAGPQRVVRSAWPRAQCHHQRLTSTQQ